MQNHRLALLNLIGGYRVSQLISASCKLGIFEAVNKAPKSLCAIQRATKSKEEKLARILNSLVHTGLLSEENGQFGLTELSRYLVEGPQSLKHFAILSGSDWYWQPWAALDRCIKSGKSGFFLTHGEPAFDFMNRNKEAAKTFHKAMGSAFSAIPDVLGKHIDFKKVKKVLDLGGGQAGLAIELTKRFPHLLCEVLDLPHARPHAKKAISSSRLSRRIRFRSGDFFKPIERNYDLIVLRHIIHDWSDSAARKILKNCRRGLTADGMIVVIERTISAPDPSVSLTDIEMMVEMEGGYERSKNDFNKLFKQVELASSHFFAPELNRDVYLLKPDEVR